MLYAPMRRPFLLLAVLSLPLAAQVQPPQSSTLSPFQQQKARALLRDQLPCLGCHELDGAGGRIGPRLTDVLTRRSAAYIAAMVDDPQRVVPGSAMPRTPMPRSTRDLVVAYFARGQSASASALPARISVRAGQDSTEGSAMYAKWCAACHGQSGRGDGPNARYLPVHPAIHASAEQMSARSDDVLFDAIAGGGMVMGKSARMPAFGTTLSAEQIRALVRHIRTLCACQGPAWSTDDQR